MTAGLPDRALQLRSLVTSQGMLELSLHDVPVPTPATNEVLVRVRAGSGEGADVAVGLDDFQDALEGVITRT